jgi:predicted nucleotidyltransferase
MSTTARPSRHQYAVDEALLSTIAAEIQTAIPGAEVRLFGSRALGNHRPDSDLDLLVTVPDSWARTHSRHQETGDLAWRLSHHRIPIDLLLYSQEEVKRHQQSRQHVVVEAYQKGRQLHGR